MKNIAFDSGPIISLATNNLLWLVEELKKAFNGEFYISENVKKEIVTKPLSSKRFRFEALQVEALIEKGVLKEKKCNQQLAEKLFQIANRIFSVENQPLTIVQRAEMETIALGIENHSESIVVDERITRTLIENPDALKNTLYSRLHKKVFMNKNEAYEFQEMCEKISVIRSAELVTLAYENSLLNKYLVNIPKSKKVLLESVLWGVKLNGCALTENEINKIIRMERV